MRRLVTFIGTLAVCTAVLLAVGLATADDGDGKGNRVKWKRMVGPIQPGSVVGGVISAAWTIAEGRARVDLDDGTVKFDVEGLSLSVQPFSPGMVPPGITAVPLVGTTGVVTKVKGTLVCNARPPNFPTLVDTELVPLSLRGNAEFHGAVLLPAVCTNNPNDLAFLIRIAEILPGGPPIVGQWIALGVVRVP